MSLIKKLLSNSYNYFATHKSALSFCAIAAIILLGCALRFPATRFGLPYSYYWDEPTYVRISHAFLDDRTLAHRWYRVPPFYFYQQTFTHFIHFLHCMYNDSIADFNDIRILGHHVTPSSLLRFCRLYTSILGIATILLVFGICKQLFSLRIAIISSLIVCLSPSHIEHSLFVTLDVPLTFMIAWTAYTSLLLWRQPTYANYFVCGLLTGLTVATKYNGTVVILLPLFIHIRTFKLYCLNKKLSFFLFIVFLSFSIGCPWWSDIGRFLSGIGNEARHYGVGIVYQSNPSFLGLCYIGYWLRGGLGLFLFPLAVAGGCVLAARWKENEAMILVFPAFYFITLATQKSDFVRNGVPMIPFLAILAAVGMDRIVAGFRHGKGLGLWKRSTLVHAIFTLIVFTPTLIQSILFSYRLSHLEDTRTQAVEWIDRNTGPGDRIWIASELDFHPEELQKLKAPYVIQSVLEINENTIGAYSLLVLSDRHQFEEVARSERFPGRFVVYDREKKIQTVDRANALFKDCHPVMKLSYDYVFPVWTTLYSFDAGYAFLNRYSIFPNVTIYRNADVK